MSINKYLRLIAGFFIILSVVLVYFHSAYWLYFTLFIGVNLLQSAFTNWCPMMAVLRRMGVKKD